MKVGRGQTVAEETPLARAHLFAVSVCALGFTFDLGEIAFGTALSGVFSAPPRAVGANALAWLLAATYAGAIAGPPVAGVLADRHGRRSALVATLMLLAVSSVAAACSSGIRALTAARFVSGIAMGAYPPLMITYLTDLLPARRRGPLIMATAAIAYVGPPAAIFLLRALTPLAPLGLEGWRWVLAAGGVGAGIGGVLFLGLPEPPRWRFAAAAAAAKLDRRRFGLVAALSFLSPWATVAFPLLTAAILMQRGFSLSDTLLYVGVSAFGPIIGTVLAASVADRIERRTALAVCALGMIATAAGFWMSERAVPVMVCSLGFNLFVALYTPAINVYVAELFPTGARARATSWAWSINRVAAALGPLLMLPLLRGGDVRAVYAIILGVLTGSLGLIVLWGPRGEAGREVT